jgi:AcrR family transcriptional regulator
MTSRLPAATRRQQLVEVATDTFGDAGFHATSMNDVAAAAGVTKPVLYQHFSSKEDLFEAVLRHVGSQLRMLLEDAASAEGLAPRQRVERGFAAYFAFLRDHRASARVLFGEARRTDESIAAEADRAVESIAEFVATLIEIDGLDDPARNALANGIVGLAEGAGRFWVRHQHDMTADELAALTAELAWSGLRGDQH